MVMGPGALVGAPRPPRISSQVGGAGLGVGDPLQAEALALARVAWLKR